jgi:hypothetical protein
VTVRWIGRGNAEPAVFTRAARWPWEAFAYFGVLCAFAGLTLIGLWRPTSALSWFVPAALALAVTWLVMRTTRERALTLWEKGDHTVLVSTGDGRRHEIRVDQLAYVEREQPGEQPSITLVDLSGQEMRLPLGVWLGEPRLMAALRSGVTAAAAKGDVGPDVPVRRARALVALRTTIALAAVVPLVVLVWARPDVGGIVVEPVTAERLRATAGETQQPFIAEQVCDIYVVPADRPSVAAVRRLRNTLATDLPAKVCSTPSILLPESVLDRGRAQVDGSLVLDASALPFRAVWPDRPAMTVAVTSHDMFTSGRPDLRFTFGSAFRFRDGLQSHAVLSTGRMGDGAAAARRLETMALRYIGNYYFGLPYRADPTVALGPSIGGLADLDRMRPELTDPPLTRQELREARMRLLATD